MTTAKNEVPIITADGPELALGGLVQIETTLIQGAPWNARKTFDRAALDELMMSIEEHGIQVPLTVRLLSSNGYYEVVAGHRRLKAACNAGLKFVPCIVRDLTDDQARELGLVDNVQRENVPAMEEATALAELLGRVGSIEQVAARVQKDQSYVAKRLKLCSLSLAAQDALRHRFITVDHALVLARLGADEQDAALKWCIDHTAGVKVSVDKVIEDRVERQKHAEEERAEEGSYRWRHTWEPQSVQKLKDHIASESGIVLDRAPWDLDWTDLIPDAAACNECPQNTVANAPLFGDLEIGEAKCTDTGCFKEKTQAFVQLKLRDGERESLNGTTEAGGAAPLLRVSWNQTSTAPRMEKDGSGINLNQVFKSGQWVEVKKKSCEHVRAAVTVDWSDGNDRGYMGGSGKLRKPGEIVQVCVEPKCKAHPKDWAKPKSKSRQGDRYDPKAEEEARKNRVEAARLETKIRVAVASKAIEGIKTIPDEVLRELVINAAPNWGHRAFDAVLPGWLKTLKTAKVNSAEFIRAAAVVSLGACIWASEYFAATEGRKAFLDGLQRLGFKEGADAWKKTSTEKAETAKPTKTAPSKTAKKAKAKPAKKAAKKGGR